MTWNIEWLSSVDTPKGKKAQRDSQDLATLSHYFELNQPDVLAFQEVNDIAAIQKVVGDNYAIVLSHRAKRRNHKHQFDDINQYTGFAIQKGLPFTDSADLFLDTNSNSKLRYASAIVLWPDSDTPLHLLSLHLKAGCSGQYRSNKNCKRLKNQGRILNQWIKEKEAQRQKYILLGDFNHNMAYPGDWLWGDISEGTEATLATRSTPAICKVRSRNNPSKTHQFRSLIDHIIVSNGLSYSPPEQKRFDSQDVLKHQLSDHCPLGFDVTNDFK